MNAERIPALIGSAIAESMNWYALTRSHNVRIDGNKTAKPLRKGLDFLVSVFLDLLIVAVHHTLSCSDAI